jgi:hypothetical protein
MRRLHVVSVRVAVADSPGPLRPPARSRRGSQPRLSIHLPEATTTGATATRPCFGATRPCSQGASHVPRRVGASSHAAPAGREQAPCCFVAGVPPKPLSERPAGREEAAAGREESAVRRELAVVGPYPALRPPPLLRAPRLPWVQRLCSPSSGCLPLLRALRSGRLQLICAPRSRCLPWVRSPARAPEALPTSDLLLVCFS